MSFILRLHFYDVIRWCKTESTCARRVPILTYALSLQRLVNEGCQHYIDTAGGDTKVVVGGREDLAADKQQFRYLRNGSEATPH